MSFEAEDFERLHKTVSQFLSSLPTEDADEALKALTAKHRAHLLNPVALFTRASPVNLQSVAGSITKDKERFGSLMSQECAQSIVDTSQSIPLDIDQILPIYLRALQMSYDPHLSGTLDTTYTPSQQASRLSIQLFRREIYCLMLTVQSIAHAASQKPSILSFLKELVTSGIVRNLQEFIVYLIKDTASSSESPEDLFVAVRAIEEAVHAILAIAIAVPGGEYYAPLLALIPGVFASTHALQFPSSATLADLDFVLQDGGLRSSEMAWRIGMAVVAGIGNSSKITPGSFSENSELSRLLSFAVSGLVNEEAAPYRNGLVYGRVLREVRLKMLQGHPSCSCSRSVASSVLHRTCLPLHRWSVLKKLCSHANRHGLLPTDALQSDVMEIITFLIRAHPTEAELLKDIVIDRTENFHNAPIAGGQVTDVTNAAILPHNILPYSAALDACTAIIARGPCLISTATCRKLFVHHNHWFNLQRLISICHDVSLPYHSSIAHLVSSVFSSRLSLAVQSPHPAVPELAPPKEPLFHALVSGNSSAAAGALSVMNWTEPEATVALQRLAESTSSILSVPGLGLLLVLFRAAGQSRTGDWVGLTDAIVREWLMRSSSRVDGVESSSALFSDLALKWIRYMQLTFTSYANRCLLSPPVFDCLAQACISGSSVALDVLRLMVVAEPKSTCPLVLKPGNSSAPLIASLLSKGVGPLTVKPLMALLQSLACYFPRELLCCLTLYPYLERTVSFSIGETILGRYDSGAEPREVWGLRSSWLEDSNSLESIFLSEASGPSYAPVVSSVTLLPIGYQAEASFLSELTQGRPECSGPSSSTIRARHKTDFPCDCAFHSYLRASPRVLALQLLNTSLKKFLVLGTSLLGLTMQIDGLVPDVLATGAADAVFLLLDNPPEDESANDWKLPYSLALDVPLLLFKHEESKAVCMRFVEYSWINRYRALRRFCATPDSPCCWKLFAISASEMLAVAANGFTENARNMREVASSWLGDGSAMLRDCLAAALASNNRQLGSSVTAFVVSASNFAEDKEAVLTGWLRMIVGNKGTSNLQILADSAFTCSAALTDDAIVRSEGADYVALQISGLLSLCDADNTETVLKTCSLLMGAYGLEAVVKSMRGGPELHHLARLLAGWTKTGDGILQDTLAAILSVEGVELEVDWELLKKAGLSAVLLEALVRSADVASRAFECSMLKKGSDSKVMISAALAMPKHETLWNTADWTFRGNKEQLKLCMQGDQLKEKSKEGTGHLALAFESQAALKH